jgi:hypothetical protein
LRALNATSKLNWLSQLVINLENVLRRLYLMKQWFIAIILFIIAGVIAACSSGAAPAEVAQVQSEAAQAQSTAPIFDTQSNNEQAVTVEVTPLNLSQGGTTLEFEIAFDTHSVDLGFDPVALSLLRDSAGNEYPALVWEGDPAGGHHRSGTLRFEVPKAPTDSVEVIIIRDIAGVPERVFQWDLVKK